VDNSDYMRNGDFLPTRLQAQQEAVTLICHSKTRSNPENNVGLLTFANNIEVLATLTTDVGRIMSKLHQVQPKGEINFISGIRIAHLALRHRQGRNHKLRIVVFVGSPITTDEKDMTKLAKRLKKEKVGIDIINFGEDAANTEKLTSFVNSVNGKEGGGPSHLITVPPGPHLVDALVSSPVIQGEDGTGAVGITGAGSFDFVDPNEDPELALALRVSMEEQRQRQEEEARRAAAESVSDAGVTAPITTQAEASNEENMLEKALAMSLEQDASNMGNVGMSVPDFAAMSEEEQIAYAMQMSLQQSQGAEAATSEATPMETDEADAARKGDSDDYSEVMNDPAFLQSVLENLPGVDPQSEAIRNAMGSLTQQQEKDKEKKEKEKDKKSGNKK